MLDLASLLGNYIFESEVEEDKARNTDCWSASSMGMCPREQFWRRQGKQSNLKEPVAYMMQRKAGKEGHKWIEEAFDKHGLLVSAEKEIKMGNLVGHYDMIIRDPENPEYWYLVDIKTVHSRKLDYLKVRGVDKHYKLQIVSYAIILRDQYPKTYAHIKGHILMFVARDDLRVMCIGQAITPELEAEINNSIKLLDDAWERQALPTGPAEPWNCSRCRYRDVCELSKVETRPEKKILNKVINL